MKDDFYCESMPYETFIRNAHKVLRGMRNGADQCFMRNLMWAEVGDSCVKHLGSYQKQFATVKKYMSKALDKYLKWKLNTEEREEFFSLKSKLENAYSTNDLMKIVNKALKLTERFRLQPA